MSDSNVIVDRLGLEGLDSELFSFLEPELVSQLVTHPSADSLLWTFGTMETRVETDQPVPQLVSVTYWNSRPSCLAFSNRPIVEQCEPDGNGKPSEWHRYRGFTTNDPLIHVTALVLVRLLFVQGYTCSLDDRKWIHEAADPAHERLGFIRDWNQPVNDSQKQELSAIWSDRKLEYFAWAFEALNQVPTALGVAKMSNMVDRCVENNS